MLPLESATQLFGIIPNLAFAAFCVSAEVLRKQEPLHLLQNKLLASVESCLNIFCPFTHLYKVGILLKITTGYNFIILQFRLKVKKLIQN